MKDGTPDEKTCTFQVIKLFPGGNEAVIAKKEVNLGLHFGEFQHKTVEFDMTKHA